MSVIPDSPRPGQLSEDHQSYWDGSTWESTLSPDGAYRWDGRRWVHAGGTGIETPNPTDTTQDETIQGQTSEPAGSTSASITDQARVMWSEWAHNHYPLIADTVLQAAMEVVRAGGPQEEAYLAALRAAGSNPLLGELQHRKGSVGLATGPEGCYLVFRTVGTRLFSRKKYHKDRRVPISQVAGILVQSRDRRVFSFDALDARGKSIGRVEGFPSKPRLDAFLHQVQHYAPDARIELAHPSYGVPDPVHESAKKMYEQALAFNRDEEQRRTAAAAGPQVKVKNYDNVNGYKRDVKRMTRQGWVPQGQVSSGSRGGSIGVPVKVAGVPLILGSSSATNKITATWIKYPPEHVPRDFVPLPSVPAPRTFPAEPYFTARNLDPVKPGHEYPPADVRN